MSTANVAKDKIVYPASDGQPMAETPEHILLMVTLIAALRHHFKPRRDVYVIGNIFLYYRKGDPTARRAPDIMVVKGVDAKAKRRSFMTWIERAVPSVIFELTSAETADEDLEIKLPLYQKLGVKEYFLFDPLNEYLPRQLMGFRLVNRRYQELTADDMDALVSKELGLRLVPNGADLDLIDIKTGQPLLGLDELSELAKELKQRESESLEEARRLEKAFKAANRRADQERLRADQEKHRADALAAELARLKAQQKQPPI